MLQRHTMLSLTKWLTLALVPSLLAVGCGKDDPADPRVSCACDCTAQDPVAHCVRTQDCSTTADCPAGTVCADLPARLVGQPFPDAVGSDPLASCGAQTPARRCQLPDGPSGRQALITGFEVPMFRLLRATSSGPVAFSWTAPEETHIVHCALFACPPVVEESVRDGRTVYRIANYEPCVMASNLFEPGEGVFDLGDGSIVFSPASGATCGGASARVVRELLAGCWAYDKSKVIAATPLEPVTPQEIFGYHDQFDLGCASEIDGRTCELEDESLGVCWEGACRAPCVTGQDCLAYEEAEEPDGGADAGGEGGVVPLACVKTGAYVGVCLPPSAVRGEVLR